MKESKEDKFVIVIGRQYGSGGRRIGRMLAQSLGISYYDQALLAEASERLGYSPDIFAQRDEKRPSFFRSMLSLNYGAPVMNVGQQTMSDEAIYALQSKVIREICENESCVIVGRSADYVLRHHPHLLSIFVHANDEDRANAIVKRGEATDRESALELAAKRDSQRQDFYNYFTNRESWGKAGNYHLCFNSSMISDATILTIVKDMLKLPE
ncbi:MAG: cytidylate kinase-like family protein [Muribaculaceae bacterium]|nr:cytidylate kinase-like family protein [Muribaculaceae bacterium]